MEQRYDVRSSKIGIEFIMNPIIKLSDNAALRIKEIMANAEKDSIGVRAVSYTHLTLPTILRV